MIDPLESTTNRIEQLETNVATLETEVATLEAEIEAASVRETVTMAVIAKHGEQIDRIVGIIEKLMDKLNLNTEKIIAEHNKRFPILDVVGVYTGVVVGTSFLGIRSVMEYFYGPMTDSGCLAIQDRAAEEIGRQHPHIIQYIEENPVNKNCLDDWCANLIEHFGIETVTLQRNCPN